MPKHPRKRQKTSKGNEAEPLGARSTNIYDDDQKDDEERRLEAMLFGTEFVPREDKGKAKDSSVRIQDDHLDDDGARELQHLMDGDLFFTDDGPVGSIPQYDAESDVSQNPIGSEVGDDDEAASDSDSEGSSRESLPSRPPTPKQQPQPIEDAFNKKRSTRKPPAWIDPADNPVTTGESYTQNEVPLSKPITRKLRDSASETSLTATEYEKRLRRQWERINPVPEWANKARAKPSDEGDDDDTDISHLLSSTTGILARPDRRRRNVVLKQGSIGIERLRDANQSVQDRDPDGAKSALGEVKVVTFHPNERIPLLCVGTSGDRRIRLFNIDGHTSPLLQTLHVPSLPITSSTSASFHPAGTHLLLTGPRPFFFTHDLQSGKTSRHARGLWGTTYALANDSSTSLNRKRGRGAENGQGAGDSMELTAFSPHTGDLLAVAGRGGYVHLVDWKSGAGQVLGSLKCGGGGGGVKGLWWTSPSSTSGPGHLAVLSGDAEVYIWDVGERKCVKRWKDDGGFRGAGRVLAGSGARASTGYLAVGSNTGYVNVYDSSAYTPMTDIETDTWGSAANNPKPLKAIANLTTPISTLRFNHDSQLMAIASKDKKDSMRLKGGANGPFPSDIGLPFPYATGQSPREYLDCHNSSSNSGKYYAGSLGLP
ncbi:hypothetical protein AX16_010794 [Volvariella volvacea WC 439]|nr:hypothetical protein AX16_010794 [Volvariella volvacea WC 439]